MGSVWAGLQRLDLSPHPGCVLNENINFHFRLVEARFPDRTGKVGKPRFNVFDEVSK